MNETILWLISMAVAFAGIGLGLKYQSDALIRPDRQRWIGLKMRRAAWVWIVLAVVWLVAVIPLLYLL